MNQAETVYAPENLRGVMGKGPGAPPVEGTTR